MSETLRTLPEVLVWPAAPGEFVVSNPFLRSYLRGDARFVELLAELVTPQPRAELVARFGGVRIRVVDATQSPFADGLLGDPTGLDRSATLANAAELDIEAALALALSRRIVVDDEAAYESFLAPRKNVLDRAHRGDLHQEVGEHVLLGLRQDVDRWWIDQKFTEDLREPRVGLYRSVQWPFMNEYYAEQRVAGKRVLDFGCGLGLFSRLFASRGASVVGLDTNADHIETAATLTADEGLEDRVAYRQLELPLDRGLAAVADERFDLIFLSDVLMFYFHPYDRSLQLDPADLLRRLAALLAPGGVIDLLEPNGSFWQRPWLGSERRPFTVLTEYRDRRYGVTPTLEQLSRAAEDAGLLIARIRELVPPAATHDRGERFAAEFPLWWFFELVPRGDG